MSHHMTGMSNFFSSCRVSSDCDKICIVDSSYSIVADRAVNHLPKHLYYIYIYIYIKILV